MAPSTASPKTVAKAKRSHHIQEKNLEEPKAAGTTPAPSPVITTKSDEELALAFRSDLQSIRTLTTCTICDQLLYEPWTLACGHTYCYSCLCSWFLPNKRKKTCPDCRTLVKQMPAPAFLIKQMTEVFINRVELMPIDETVDQHRERLKSESDIIEVDRACEAGLFKGCFNKQAVTRLQFNEEDHLYRCTRCSHEYIGGPMCENCGLDFEGDEEDIDIGGFSDVDDDDSVDGFDYHDYHVDLDADTDDDNPDMEDFGPPPEIWLGQGLPVGDLSGSGIISWGPSMGVNPNYGQRRSSDSSSGEHSEDEEETESMRDFIEDDEDHPEVRASYHYPGSSRDSGSIRGDDGIEDDEYDEGGDVSTGRRSRPRRSASVVTVTDSTPTSEAGDLAEESREPHAFGWNQLGQEADSDNGEEQTLITDNSGDSESDITVGNQDSDEDSDDDDRHRDNNSSTPTWMASRNSAPYSQDGVRGQSGNSNASDEEGEVEGYDSEAQATNVTDTEGDVEMSVSPASSCDSSTGSSSDERQSRRSVEILGSTNAIHEVEDDSSDGTVQPAIRRRRQLRYSRHSQTPEYDPRISMMFAQHQSDLRDATARQSPYFEPASRTRNASSYRLLPPRGSSLLGNVHSLPAVILTSVSNRPNRVQRQYARRYFI